MKWYITLFRRAVAGGKRFAASSVWGMLLFLWLSYMAFMGEMNSVWTLRLGEALGDTMLASILWQLGMEYTARDKDRMISYGGTLGIFVVFFLIMILLSAPAYIFMSGTGIALIMSLVSLYILSLQGTGETLFSIIFLGFLQSTGTAFVTELAIALCLSAISFLLLPVPAYIWMTSLFFSIFIVGWNLMLSWIPGKGERKVLLPAMEKLLARILIPVYLVYIIILYGYIGKIIYEGHLPVGIMNWYGSIAILGYVFFYFMLHGTTSVMIHRFLKWGSLALVPVIIVQIMGIHVRLDAYGFTTIRYLSVLCTAFGIITMIYGFFGRSMKPLYLICSGLVFLAALTPFNAIDFPAHHQEKRILTVLKANNMVKDGTIVEGNIKDREELKTIKSAYDYLAGDASLEADPMAVAIVDSPVLKKLKEKGIARTWNYAYRGDYDITGWDRLIPVGNISAADGKTIQVRTSNGTETFNIETTIKEVMDGNTDDTKPLTTDIDSTHRILWKNLFVRRTKDGTVRANGDGLLLERTSADSLGE